jgi:hypothetical protein
MYNGEDSVYGREDPSSTIHVIITSAHIPGQRRKFFARRIRTITYPVAWCASSVESVRNIAIVDVLMR